MSLPQSDPSELGKAAAGKKAAEAVSAGMKLGLGTGSTVAHFLEALGTRVKNGELPGIIGVPTSIRTENHAAELGIPLTTLESVDGLDLTVDGADEVDPHLDLIKGLGGALLREKMVAQATQRLIIIADESKIVEKLGTRSPLPIEVVPFGWQSHLPFLEELEGRPFLRENPDGTPFSTDNRNYILDCRFPQGISDAGALESALNCRAGIVESGLFLGMAQEVLVGGVNDVRSISL